MATVAVANPHFLDIRSSKSASSRSGRENVPMEVEETRPKDGLRNYYIAKIEELQSVLSEKSQDVRRLEAQRNELNAKVRMLREELMLLQEQSSYVGEVIKPMDKKKVLVKVHPDGKFVVDLDKSIEMSQVTPNCRVALRNDSYTLHKILPSKIDPLVSLMMVEKVPDSTYDMVGGLDKQIKEIKEVIELPVKHPELFEALGIEQPKGVLLYGPPGTGKTLLARAVAHHTECTFIRVSGSELVQKFIGEGSRMVRELFVMAREHAPSIIFMDEIDSIGSSRIESGSGGGDSEVQRTMLELLNQLDGFEATKNIKVIMATNRIDILDSALLRPGRIDRKIEFPPPNEDARLDILKIHSRKMNLTRGINLRKIAEQMGGSSGAEVKGTCTEAGMYALRERRVHVTQEEENDMTENAEGTTTRTDAKEDAVEDGEGRSMLEETTTLQPGDGDVTTPKAESETTVPPFGQEQGSTEIPETEVTAVPIDADEDAEMTTLSQSPPSLGPTSEDTESSREPELEVTSSPVDEDTPSVPEEGVITTIVPEAVVTLLTTVRPRAQGEDQTEQPEDVEDDTIDAAEEEKPEEEGTTLAPEDAGMHEFDCSEFTDAELAFADPNQIPLQCRLRPKEGGEPKTVYILIPKQGLDLTRLFDKNVKVA